MRWMATSQSTLKSGDVQGPRGRERRTPSPPREDHSCKGAARGQAEKSEPSRRRSAESCLRRDANSSPRPTNTTSVLQGRVMPPEEGKRIFRIL